MSAQGAHISRQRIALIGAGFTLSRAAGLFPPGDIVLTASTAESVRELSLRFPSVMRLAIEQPGSLGALLGRFSAVKTVVDGVPPPDDWSAERLFDAAKARGAEIKALGIERLLYVSSTGVYGTSDGSWVTEGTAPHPKFKRGKARLAVEEGYRESLGGRCTALRVPAIYGPSRGIGTSIKIGRYKLIEGGTRWTNRIEVTDLARAIVAAIQAPALPPVLVLSDGTPAQACEVVDYYCATFKLPRPKSISEEEAFAAKLETLLSNQRVDSRASWKALGLEPLIRSYKEGAAGEMTALSSKA